MEPLPTTRLPQYLIATFEDARSNGQSLALVTVVSTEGSTYSKAGDHVVIEDSGKVHGLISGGCLEGDLAERAVSCIKSGLSTTVEYDLRDDDEVFGLGVGCEGKVSVLIQPLSPGNEYQPFAGYVGDFGPVRVLLLGGGADVGPLLDYGHWLGWATVVIDHRPHYIDSLDPPASCEAMNIATDEIDTRVDLDSFDVAIVMSHHLTTDKRYLELLAASKVPFIGLLGPPHRRDRLLKSMGPLSGELAGRLRAPVGKEIGGRGPGAIALEIATEVHEFLLAET